MRLRLRAPRRSPHPRLLHLPRLLLLSSTVLVLAPVRLAAQVCKPQETLGECFRRYEGRVTEASQEEVLRSEFRRLAGKLTGGAGALGPALSSALGDFLPFLAGAPTLGGENGDRLGFDVETNLPLYHRPGAPVQPPNLAGNLQLRAHSQEPTVFGPLQEDVPAAERVALVELLGEELDFADDLAFSAVWNLESGGFGRAFPRHTDVFESLFAEAVVRAGAAVSRPSLSASLAPFVLRLDEILDPSRADTPECDAEELDQYRFDCFREPARSQMADAIAASATGYRDFRGAIADELREVGFFRLVDLLNNQPQVSVSVSTRVRSDAVGPDSYSFGVRYEHGFANLNALRGYCSGAAPTLSCLGRYLAEPAVASTLGKGDRAWFSLELLVTEDYAVDRVVGDTPVQLELDGSYTLKGGLGYGRYLRLDRDGADMARVDLTVEGEISERSSGRNDRVVASLTYTHRISDGFSFPLGVTYANKPEFLGEADRKVGVHLGFRYRLHRDPPRGAGGSVQ